MNMTSRERVECAHKHMQPDRTPFFEYVLLLPIAEKILNRRYIDYAGDEENWLKYAQEKGLEPAVRQHAIYCRMKWDSIAK